MNGGIKVYYLTRGADAEFENNITRFVNSYRTFTAGQPHDLIVIFKGFSSDGECQYALKALEGLTYTRCDVDDNSLDIGAYIDADALSADSPEWLCFFNSHTAILIDGWLDKLWRAANLPGVGMVGSTASYESLISYIPTFPAFPNPHLRSTGFMLRREEFRRLTRGIVIRDKDDAFGFESGNQSITRRVIGNGQRVLIVGRNGRGYDIADWPTSETFRLGRQSNLLIGDNQTRAFEEMSWPQKRRFSEMTWGGLLDPFAAHTAMETFHAKARSKR